MGDEPRQNAGDLAHRAEAGEQVTIVVSERTWRRWDDIAEIFAGPADADRAADRDRLDG